MWLDGAWCETQGPIVEEVKKIDRTKQTLGFGEFSASAYIDELENNPKYVDHLKNEGKMGHLDVKKFAEWITQKEIPIVAGKEKLESAERSGMHIEGRVNSVVFGFLIIFEGNQGESAFGECYQWVFCFKVVRKRKAKRFLFGTRISWVWKDGISHRVELRLPHWRRKKA